MLFTGLLLTDCSVCNLIAASITSPEVAPLTLSFGFSHQALIKKMPHGLTHSQLELGDGVF